MLNPWDKWFLELSNTISLKSKDPSTKVGCVIVDNEHSILAVGYNGFPRGVNDSLQERYERPVKYQFTEHAERNAIYNAARNGVALKGATLYCNRKEICPDCARAIIQSGIKSVKVSGVPINTKNWLIGFEISRIMFKESNVRFKVVKIL